MINLDVGSLRKVGGFQSRHVIFTTLFHYYLTTYLSVVGTGNFMSRFGRLGPGPDSRSLSGPVAVERRGIRPPIPMLLMRGTGRVFLASL